ncbi:hypothetical protein THSYN_10970 [Candidatus Thiodictyon syntrophicum]|uniref:Uncharacterized protein n=1 Tax=Candidatus Thiodictyon syntrophicum TaxID=1166950 RepID=A0A2K8U760_9GAMM|nr:hypothetical protein THSYN_10970 [Candidatus Thiodictyon syntrophicum]
MTRPFRITPRAAQDLRDIARYTMRTLPDITNLKPKKTMLLKTTLRNILATCLKNFLTPRKNTMHSAASRTYDSLLI